MVTYKERAKKRKVFVLLKGKVVLGTFGNLKKVCEFMEGKDFPSYWTLTRKKEDSIEYNEYSIHRVRLY